MTDALDLQPIKARRDAASVGSWEAKAYRVYVGGEDRIIAACWRPWGPVTGDGSIEADAEFIAHAREDVPALVSEVERLRSENAKWQADFENAERRWSEADARHLEELEEAHQRLYEATNGS